MFDLNQLDTATKSNEGVDFILRDPKTGEPYTITVKEDGKDVLKPVTIRVLGPESPKFEAIAKKTANAFLKESIQGERKQSQAQSGVSIDKMKADTIDLCVTCTLDWKNFTLDGTTEYPCTPENARTIYTQFPLLLEQVANFIRDRANFLLKN